MASWLTRIIHWRIRRVISRTPILPPDRSPFSRAQILVHAEDPQTLQAAQKLEAMLADVGIQVAVLAYFPDRQEHPETSWSYFTRRALNIWREPRGELIDQFIAKPVDLLIGCYQGPIPPLDYLTARWPARVKLGPEQALPVFTVQLAGHGSGLHRFAGHVTELLPHLQTALHVPS